MKIVTPLEMFTKIGLRLVKARVDGEPPINYSGVFNIGEPQVLNVKASTSRYRDNWFYTVVVTEGSRAPHSRSWRTRVSKTSNGDLIYILNNLLNEQNPSAEERALTVELIQALEGSV